MEIVWRDLGDNCWAADGLAVCPSCYARAPKELGPGEGEVLNLPVLWLEKNPAQTICVQIGGHDYACSLWHVYARCPHHSMEFLRSAGFASADVAKAWAERALAEAKAIIQHCEALRG